MPIIQSNFVAVPKQNKCIHFGMAMASLCGVHRLGSGSTFSRNRAVLLLCAAARAEDLEDGLSHATLTGSKLCGITSVQLDS